MNLIKFMARYWILLIGVATSITANNVTTEAAETIELLNSAINVTEKPPMNQTIEVEPAEQNATNASQIIGKKCIQNRRDTISCNKLKQEEYSNAFTLYFENNVTKMQICDALCEAMDSLAPRVDLYIKEMAESGDYRNARFQVTIILYQSNNGSELNSTCHDLNPNQIFHENNSSGKEMDWRNVKCVEAVTCQTLFWEFFTLWIALIAIAAALLIVSLIASIVYCWRRKHTGSFKRYSDNESTPKKKKNGIKSGLTNPCVVLNENDSPIKKSPPKKSHPPPPIPEEKESSTEYSTEHIYDTAIVPYENGNNTATTVVGHEYEIEDTKM